MLNTVLNNHQLLIWIQTTFELEEVSIRFHVIVN